MPNSDSILISNWIDEEAGAVLINREYVRHFSEVVTRKLRRELQAGRVEEPKYTHSLDDVEMTALYFLQSAQASETQNERIALFHEAAILFEQLSSLRSQEDLKQENASEINVQRQITAACSYFLAGYEANAAVMAGILKETATLPEVSFTAYLVSLLLSKNLRELREILADVSLRNLDEDSIMLSLREGNYLFGDAIYDASVRVLLRAISFWIHWLRTGESKIREEASNNLLLAIKGLDGCGRVLDSMILKLLIDIFGVWHERSPWNRLSPVLTSEFSIEWKQYVRLLTAGDSPITEFWRSQLQIIPDVLNLSSGLVISLPTSAGKTRLAEIAIANELTSQRTKKAVYIVPTRALAAEIEQTLSLRLGPMNFGITALYGGYDMSDFEEELLEKNRILILTPEKLDLLMRSKDGFTEQICLVVVDEGHQVASGPRGLRLEFILSRIRWHSQKYGIKFLMLSAVLPNGEELAQWLSGNPQDSKSISWKPSRARKYRFTWGGIRSANDGQLRFLDDYPEEIEPFIPRLVNRRNIKSRDDVLIQLAFHFAKIGPTMIFSITKKRVEDLVELLLSKVTDQINGSLSKSQQTVNSDVIPSLNRILGRDHILVRALRKGIAFHHGALPIGARRIIEDSIRSGLIPLFVANETLAAGVNLPVKNILVDTVNRGNSPMSVRDFANVVGRAGRAGKETEANIIFLPDNDFNYPSYLQAFVDSRIEPAESQIISTVLESIIPSDNEWMKQYSKEINRQSQRGFVNPWTLLLENCSLRLEQRIGKKEVGEFRNHLRNALTSRLRPSYSYPHWKLDKPIRSQIILDAIRSSMLTTNECSRLMDVDINGYKDIVEIIDSQIIALGMEEIFDPADPETVLKFIPFTLVGSQKFASDEMKRQYSEGLKKRFMKVIQAVPQADLRRKYNKTGLSVDGNQFLFSNVSIVKKLILDWIDDSKKWPDLVREMLEIVDQVADLKPQRGFKRQIDVILAWLDGAPLNRIAIEYFGGDLSKATQVTERSISQQLPWGVNSLIELMTEDDFKPRELSPLIRNLPGMVSFGLPDPHSVYAFSLGVNDREIAMKVANNYEFSLTTEEKSNYSFSEFTKWFCSLHENIELLNKISEGDTSVGELIRKASEMKAVGLLNKMRRSRIEIPQKCAGVFNHGEEVILFKDASKEMNWFVLDYLNHKKLECKVSELVDFHLNKYDWIAKWDKSIYGTFIDVTFVG